MEDRDHRRLTATEQNVVAAYRSMKEWLLSLSDDEYDAYLALPFTARLAMFSSFRLKYAQRQRVHLGLAPGGTYRGDQVAFLRT